MYISESFPSPVINILPSYVPLYVPDRDLPIVNPMFARLLNPCASAQVVTRIFLTGHFKTEKTVIRTVDCDCVKIDEL